MRGEKNNCRKLTRQIRTMNEMRNMHTQIFASALFFYFGSHVCMHISLTHCDISIFPIRCVILLNVLMFCFVMLWFGSDPCCFTMQLCRMREKKANKHDRKKKPSHPSWNIWKCCTHIHFCWIGNQVVSFFSEFSRCLFARLFFALISRIGIYAAHTSNASKQTYRRLSRHAFYVWVCVSVSTVHG